MTTNLLHRRDDPAWLRDVTAWVDANLAMRNMARRGPAEEVRVMPWSAVYRFPVAGRDSADEPAHVYFKACAPSQAFEPALARYLAERRPDDVLPVLAADLGRAWLLLLDGGPVLRYVLTGDAADLVAHWSAVLPQLAALQVDLTADAGRLLALGVLDRRPAVLPSLLLRLLDSSDRWPLGHPDGLTGNDLPHFRDFLAPFSSLCEELAALGPPDTLVIDDFHDGHIFVRPPGASPRYRFFDYGDACVGHPWFQLISPQRFYPRAHDDLELDDVTVAALYDRYIAGWSGSDPAAVPSDHRRALDLALAVGPVIRALTWLDALGPHYPDLPADLMGHYARGIAHWLGETEARCHLLV